MRNIRKSRATELVAYLIDEQGKVDRVDAVNNVHAVFVGTVAYEAAGGRVNRDLFALSDDAPGYWLDADILARCVDKRLDAEAERVRRPRAGCRARGGCRTSCAGCTTTRTARTAPPRPGRTLQRT